MSKLSKSQRKALLKSILEELKKAFPELSYEEIVRLGLKIYEDKLIKIDYNKE